MAKATHVSNHEKAPEKDIILALHKTAGNVAQAAMLVGIAKATLQRRIKASKNLQQAYDDARAVDEKAIAAVEAAAVYTKEKVMDDLENTRVRALEDGKWQSAIRASELQGKELGMFVERKELTGKDGAPLFQEMTNEQLESRIAFLIGQAGTAPGS